MAEIVEGTITYVQGSGKKPYELQLKGGVYSCSCPAWRNQSNPIDRRTCKHLRLIRGDAKESLRVAGMHGVGVDSGRIRTDVPNQSVLPGVALTPKETRALEVLRKLKDEDPAEFERVKKWVDGLPEPDYASVEKDFVAKHPGLAADPYGVKDQILADAEKQAGRKLRPDEKTKLFGPPVLLAHPFEDADVDPTGWWFSEKLDGVRAWWDGKDFISRQGNVFHAPAWFKEGLPDHPLDGELWIDRRSFQQTISIVKSVDAGERWKAVKYMVFDMPHLKDLPFSARYERLDELVLNTTSKVLKIVLQRKVFSRAVLKAELDTAVRAGAEGLMVRDPAARYEAGRSWSILKVKPWKDAEATVTGYEAGKGRHKGRTGGLVVKTDDGIEFNLGTGLSDKDRLSPPAVGTRITYRYMDKTDAGVPKGASFVCARDYE